MTRRFGLPRFGRELGCHAAGSVQRPVADFPWLLSPAAAIIAVVLGVNQVARAQPGHEPLRWAVRHDAREA